MEEAAASGPAGAPAPPPSPTNAARAAGARITGAGTPRILVEGVSELRGCEHRVIPDRIEAGTFLCAAAITDGELLVQDCPLFELEAVVQKLREMGMSIDEARRWILRAMWMVTGRKTARAPVLFMKVLKNPTVPVRASSWPV